MIAAAHSQSLAAELPLRPELRVAISDVAPFGYVENGQIKGLNYDIFVHLEKAANMKFGYTLYPYARIKNLLPTENPDLVILFAPACKHNNEEYEIQSRLYQMKSVLYIKPNIGAGKLKDIRVGRVRGTCGTLIKEHVKPENVVELVDFKQALAMLELGRLEGVCALDTVYKYNRKKFPEFTQKVTVYKSEFHGDTFDAVLCRRKDLTPVVKAQLEKALKNVDTVVY